MADPVCLRENFFLLQQMQSCHKALHPLFKVRVSGYENHQTKSHLYRLQKTEMFQLCSMSPINNNNLLLIQGSAEVWKVCCSLKNQINTKNPNPNQQTSCKVVF